MTVSIWQTTGQEPALQETTDVVVIGAGLVGCTAAVFLKQLGLEVILLDAREVGMGASSRNAGFMLTGLDTYYHQAEQKYGEATTREIWSLSRKTHAFWLKVAKEHGVFVEQNSSLLLAESPQEAHDLEQAARRLEVNGFECEFISYDPLGRGYYGAIRQPQDGGLQPYDLVQALLKTSGARFIGNSEVYRVDSEPQEMVVYSQRAIIRAQKVLICTNAYAPLLDPFFIGKIIPHRAQCLATAPLPERVLNAVGYSDYGYMYYRDLPDGGLLIGGGRKQYQAMEGNTTDDRITDPVQQILEYYLTARFPEAQEVPIIRRWSGIMGFTPDGLPMVGSLPRDARIGYAAGFNGHGLSLGAGVAERAVDWLVNGVVAGILDGGRLD